LDWRGRGWRWEEGAAFVLMKFLGTAYKFKLYSLKVINACV
jgi:hypothetical protein